MFVSFLLYIFQLLISYFIWRKVYIKLPYMVDTFLLSMTLLPIVGIIAPLIAFSFIDDGNYKKKVLDFLFMVKKA